MRYFVVLCSVVFCAVAYAKDKTITCVDRVCSVTTTEDVVTTVSVDEQVARKSWLKARNLELNGSIERDTARYVTEPTNEISRNAAEIEDINDLLDELSAAGANVTNEDESYG